MGNTPSGCTKKSAEAAVPALPTTVQETEAEIKECKNYIGLLRVAEHDETEFEREVEEKIERTESFEQRTNLAEVVRQAEESHGTVISFIKAKEERQKQLEQHLEALRKLQPTAQDKGEQQNGIPSEPKAVVA